MAFSLFSYLPKKENIDLANFALLDVRFTSSANRRIISSLCPLSSIAIPSN